MKILLSGYYGHGNFGDDVLFVAALTLVRKLWPSADLAVQSEAANPSYLDQVAGESLPIVRLGEAARFDLIVHGGGGNFFDFRQGGFSDRAVNAVARAIGPATYGKAFRALRSIFKRGAIEGRRRVSLGLGIGTYTASARRLRSELPVLADMDFLGVRDAWSELNLRALGIAAPVHVTGDLAFAGGWGDSKSSEGPVVAVVRDLGNECDNRRQVDAVRAIADHHRLVVYLFDEAADRGILPLLGGLMVDAYIPGKLEPVTDALAAAPTIVTARAHGGICGAILDTPSVLLPIEPKLAAVHEMLPASTILLDWQRGILPAFHRARSISRGDIASDVGRNRAMLKLAIDAMVNDARLE